MKEEGLECLEWVRFKKIEQGGFMATKAKSSKRELVNTGRDKRYVRRDEKGRFDEVVDVGRSLRQDARREAKTKVPPGQGDRGDQKPRGKS